MASCSLSTLDAGNYTAGVPGLSQWEDGPLARGLCIINGTGNEECANNYS